MLERAEINMSMCASFNHRNVSCPKMIVAILHFTRAETFIIDVSFIISKFIIVFDGTWN